MMNKLVLFLPLIILITIGSALAQGRGKIAGKVTDQNTGEPLPGCNVMIENTFLGAATDEEGYFVILNIPPGTYDVSAAMIGYVKKLRSGVKVASNLTTKLEFSLQQQVIEGEEISVEAYRKPPVQKDLTFKIQGVTSEEIKRIPITTISDVLAQQAGITRNLLTSPVSSMPQFGQFATIPSDNVHFRGGRENETLFLFDGVNVTNGLWGGYSITPIPQTLMSSMEAFTGTFGPEYGNAMSGVVNIATYDNIDVKPKISAMAFTDNFGIEETSHNTKSYEVFLSSALPFAKNIGIVLSHRLYSTDGYIYGYIYPEYVNSEGTNKSGNPKEVPMQYEDTQFSFSKIIWKPTKSLKAVIGGYHTRGNRGLYNHFFKYNPYGTPRVEKEDNLFYSHIYYYPGANSYFKLTMANVLSRFQSRVFDNAESYQVRPQKSTGEFSISGEDWVYFNTHFRRSKLSLDYNHQLTRVHNLSVGANYNKLNTTLARKNPDGFAILENYIYDPVEIHGYVQDKMEFEEMGMIVNLGLRFDHINTNRYLLENLAELSNLEADMKKEKTLSYVTPRLGISFPVAESAAIRFGYGHYYQFPNYYKVFQGTFYAQAIDHYRPNPELADAQTGIAGLQMKPEKTINYEVGIQNKISESIALDITGFYRKTSNLVGILVSETETGKRFQLVKNLDYATIKGLEFSLKKYFSNNFSASLNYTYSKTLVSTSVFFTQPIDEARTFPANWDQPHVFNGNVYFRADNGFGFSIYGSAQSGFPYTRSMFDPNGERAPWIHSLDLNVFKDFEFFGINEQLYVQILNVPNRKNVWWVYSDSGIAGDDADEATSHDYTNNPAMYGPGRVIQIGMRIWN